MEAKTVKELIASKNFPDTGKNSELVETHISWVILADNRVYKIKKPFKHSFLDFSTLSKRKFYCEEELRLNKRLAPAMYKRVLPVLEKKGRIYISDEKHYSQSEVIDFALEMVKLDEDFLMNKRLKEQKVFRNDIEKIAQKVASFHEATNSINQPFDLKVFKDKFNDINTVKSWLKDYVGDGVVKQIEEAQMLSDKVLEELSEFLKNRNDKGFVKDGHGDLHSKNIFLYDDPVIFDCIEFNEKFRQIDTLNEIGFFCMDLEYNGAHALSQAFYEKYCHLSYSENPDDLKTQRAFKYFKSYRANVRGKVIALKLMDLEPHSLRREKERVEEMRGYFSLMVKYLKELSKEKA